MHHLWVISAVLCRTILILVLERSIFPHTALHRRDVFMQWPYLSEAFYRSVLPPKIFAHPQARDFSLNRSLLLSSERGKSQSYGSDSQNNDFASSISAEIAVLRRLFTNQIARKRGHAVCRGQASAVGRSYTDAVHIMHIMGTLALNFMKKYPLSQKILG